MKPDPARRPTARRGPSRTRPRPATFEAMARSGQRPSASVTSGAGGGPPRARRQPRIDDRLAPPETRLEYIDGIERFAAPADPPHATAQARLAYVLGAHVAPGYTAAVEMLTRTGETSDFAPDASVFDTDPDLETGGRKLEELAFEVADKQALSVPTKKARKLARRGVRRVFCLLVGKARMLEWSTETDGWRTMGVDDVIDDRCLARPLPVRAMLEAAASDEAVVAALRARKVPAFEAALADERQKGEARGRAEGRAEGKAEGRVEGEAKGRAEGEAKGEARGEAKGLRLAVADLCDVLGIALSSTRRARLEAMGLGELEALRLSLKQRRAWPEPPSPRRPATRRPARTAPPKAPAKKR